MFWLLKEVVKVFSSLKEKFQQALVLTHFNPNMPIQVKTSASGFTIGELLIQLAEGWKEAKHWHPVTFFSWKMMAAEWNYKVHDGELLAIVIAFKEWQHYLDGSQFPITVLTDHANL